VAPLVLATVIGDKAEDAFRQSMLMSSQQYAGDNAVRRRPAGAACDLAGAWDDGAIADKAMMIGLHELTTGRARREDVLKIERD
jgi:hypothetical protein